MIHMPPVTKTITVGRDAAEAFFGERRALRVDDGFAENAHPCGRNRSSRFRGLGPYRTSRVMRPSV